MTGKEKKLSLEHFIKKAKELEAKKEKIFLIEAENFGLIEFRRPTSKEILNYIDVTSNSIETDEENKVISQDIRGILEASKELVYQTCSYLQSSKLLEDLEIDNPLDTPVKIFGINGTNDLATKIMGKVNGKKIAEEAVEEVKKNK